MEKKPTLPSVEHGSVRVDQAFFFVGFSFFFLLFTEKQHRYSAPPVQFKELNEERCDARPSGSRVYFYVAQRISEGSAVVSFLFSS